MESFVISSYVLGKIQDAAMRFSRWKRKCSPSQLSMPARSSVALASGGMRERELQIRLDLLLDTVMTPRRSVLDPARILAKWHLVEQKRFINCVERIAMASPELAYQCCRRVTTAVLALDDAACQRWIDGLMERFGDEGLDAAILYIDSHEMLDAKRVPHQSLITLKETDRVLGHILKAISGRTFKLSSTEQSHADTGTIYLPSNIGLFTTREENFRLYKAKMIHQWAQTAYGTWDIDVAESLSAFSDIEHAIRLFHWLEPLRLDACLVRDLPGLAREMATLRSTVVESDECLKEAGAMLRRCDASVRTSIVWLQRLYPLRGLLEAAPYQGQLHLGRVASANDDTGLLEVRGPEGHSNSQQSFESTIEPQPSTDYSGQGSPMPAGAASELPGSLEKASDEYASVQAVKLEYDATERTAEIEVEREEAFENADDTSFVYDEWDHTRQRYRENWCRMVESSVKPLAGRFVTQTLEKHRGLLKPLQRTFEAMRQENQPLKRQSYGEDVDIDASVESWADACAGLPESERHYLRTQRQERNVAVMLMIDMSASTTGLVNQVERESLILLCESLEALSD
jgi:nitric oxide reductase NorD protein